MATIGNVNHLGDEGTSLMASERRRLFSLKVAYYPNGKIAYLQISVGGAVVFIALLAHWVPWSELIHVLTKLR